jgi:signal transduction histidine kinase/ligand-binding sensor domain-containing protein
VRNLLLGGSLLLFGLPARAADDPAAVAFSLETWQTDRGLPQSSVNALIQSQDGYLWMGTYNGLVRFDGVRFAVFDSGNTPVMRNSRITSLFEDHTDNLWIGHETGDLTLLTNGVFQNIPLGDAWPGGTLVGIGEDEHRDLWLLNLTGDALRFRDRFLLRRFPGIGQEPGGAPEMVRDQSGRLIVTRNGAVAALDHNRWEHMPFDDPKAFYSRVYRAQEGGLWVAALGRVRRWQNNTWAQEAGTYPAELSFIPTMIETRNGRVLLGGINLGLVVCQPGAASFNVGLSNGLTHDWVKCILEDREKNIWVGTRGGLNVLRPRKVVVHNPPDGWHNTLPLSITRGARGTIWAGSEGSGLYKFFSNTWQRFGPAEGLGNPFVWSVLEDRSGAVWAGTWSGGLFRGQNGVFAIPPALADLKDPVTALAEGADGTIWIGTGKGLARYREGRLDRLAGWGGAAAGDVRALALGPEGTLWIGSLGAGLGRLSGDRFTSYTQKDGLAQDFILSLFVEDSGTLWIGTLEQGLCRLQNGRFTTIGTKAGLPNKVIGHIADDDHGRLWFNSSFGIFAASLADLHRMADVSNSPPPGFLLYGLPEGLASLAGSAGFTPSGFRAPDGTLWFPNSKGLAVVNPAQVERNLIPPPVVVEEVSMGGRAHAVPRRTSSHLEVPPGAGQVDIRFTALSFTAPGKVRFQWRLQGLDPRWSEPSSQRSVSYSYLPPGKYEFQLLACNNDGLWAGAPATLALTVLPFFYETWWFKLVITLAGLASFAGLIMAVQRARVRRKLERAARERDLERERTRIAQDIHDDLGASLTRIGMLSQTAAENPSDPAHTGRYLDLIYRSARDMTRSMDEIVWALNTRHDTLESLFNYLTRFAHEFLTPARIRCRLQVPVDVPDHSVSSEIRHNLFLAFKEALNNIVRHSGASETRLDINLEGDSLRVIIADDGHGFDPTGPAGNGLANIRERIRQINGETTITPSPAGTTVTLRVPLAAQPRRVP